MESKISVQQLRESLEEVSPSKVSAVLDSHPNPHENYALHSVRLKADVEALGWAMRDKKWWRAASLLGRILGDVEALEAYVSERLPPTTSAKRP